MYCLMGGRAQLRLRYDGQTPERRENDGFYILSSNKLCRRFWGIMGSLLGSVCIPKIFTRLYATNPDINFKIFEL